MKSKYFETHLGGILKSVLILVVMLAVMTSCYKKQESSATTEVPAESEVIIAEPGQSLGIASVPNLRDMGGYETNDGATVVRGLVYRSNQLAKISPEDMEKIAQLGLKNDYDLRTEAERTPLPDELPPGVNNIWLDVLKDASGAAPANLLTLLQNPEEGNKALGDGKIEATFITSYRDFVSLSSAKAAYHEFFTSLADQNKLPALFHCTTGKDRTGWAAAALLTLTRCA